MNAKLYVVGQSILALLTWKSDDAKCCTKKQDGVANIVEVEVLQVPCAQEYEEDDKDQTMHAVVHVVHGGLLGRHKAEGGKGGGQNDKEGHERGDGSVLEAEDVPPEEALQLVVLEAVAVEKPRERHLN